MVRMTYTPKHKTVQFLVLYPVKKSFEPMDLHRKPKTHFWAPQILLWLSLVTFDVVPGNSVVLSRRNNAGVNQSFIGLPIYQHSGDVRGVLRQRSQRPVIIQS